MAGHLVGDLACVEVEPKPLGGQWGPGDEVGRVLGVVGPAEGVEDQGEGRNLEEGGLGVRDPLVAGQTDQREQEEEVCRHDLEDQPVEGGGPGLEVEVLEDQGDQVDQEGDEEDPAFHLNKRSTYKDAVICNLQI